MTPIKQDIAPSAPLKADDMEAFHDNPEKGISLASLAMLVLVLAVIVFTASHHHV